MRAPYRDRRLVLVTGKGGVGKTTIATALAFAAAREGRRACVVELYGQGRVAALFGLGAPAYEPRAIADNVDTMSLTPMASLDDFGTRKLKLDALVRLVLRNRAMHAFVDAVPGLHDLLQLGKIENLLLEPARNDPRYDLMVVDAPATGHGLTLLASPRTMREMARVGPFHDLARTIERLIEDPDRTGVVVATLPEDLPVNETVELVEALGDERSLLDGIVVNQVRAKALPPAPPWPAVRGTLLDSPDPDVRELASLGDGFVARQEAQDAAISRLGFELDRLLGRRAPVATLPRLEAQDLGPGDLPVLADALRSALGGGR